MSTTHRVLMLVLGVAEIAWAVRIFALIRESARTGRQFREIGGAVATVLVGVLLSVAVVVVAATA